MGCLSELFETGMIIVLTAIASGLGTFVYFFTGGNDDDEQAS